MQDPSEGERLRRQGLPIDILRDPRIHQRSIMEERSDAFYGMANIVHGHIKEIGTDTDITPELIDDIAHTMALRDALLDSDLLSRRMAGFEAQRQTEMDLSLGERLTGTTLTMEALYERSRSIEVADVYDYFLDKLESYTNFLATGQLPTNWPSATGHDGMELFSIDTLDEVRTIAETLYGSMVLFIDELGGNIDCIEYIQRYQDWLQAHCGLLLEYGKIALAAPLISTARRIDETQILIDKLTLAMSGEKLRDEDEYRALYGFVSKVLREPYLSDFLRANKQSEAPLTFGAKRTIERVGEMAVMIEQFEDGEPTFARLADDTLVVLPYRSFNERGVFNYRTPTEREMTSAQTSINYNELEEGAKAAIEKAWEAEELEKAKEETLPHYKRLALKPDPLLGHRLHTVRYRDGLGRRMHPYPDDHGMLSSDTEPNIDNPVTSLQVVSDGWMVLPYDGGYVSWATYRDIDPNFFGPGPNKANAFWVAGNARMVFDSSHNPKYMKPNQHSQAHDEVRWVVVPVRYYWAEEQLPDTLEKLFD